MRGVAQEFRGGEEGSGGGGDEGSRGGDERIRGFFNIKDTRAVHRQRVLSLGKFFLCWTRTVYLFLNNLPGYMSVCILYFTSPADNIFKTKTTKVAWFSLHRKLKLFPRKFNRKKVLEIRFAFNSKFIFLSNPSSQDYHQHRSLKERNCWVLNTQCQNSQRSQAKKQSLWLIGKVLTQSFLSKENYIELKG